MVKMVVLVKRGEGMTHEDYIEHVLEHHAPMALVHHPRMRRYSVAPIVPGDHNPGGFDAVAELWFDSVEDFEEHLYESEEGRRAIADDIASLLSGPPQIYATEEIVFKDELGQKPVYRPGDPVPALGGRILPGAGWTDQAREIAGIDQPGG